MKTKEQVLKFISDKRVSDKTIDEVTGTLFINGHYDLAIAMRNAIAKREVLTTEYFFDWFDEGEKVEKRIEKKAECNSDTCMTDEEIVSLIDEYLDMYVKIDNPIYKSCFSPFAKLFNDVKKEILNKK